MDQFTGINESSFLGLDEEDAVKNAKQSYLDNKYFFDHADDGIDEALDKSNNFRKNDFDDYQEGEERKKNI